MVAVGMIGAAVIGGVASSISASNAADAQEDAANRQIAEQRAQYRQTREDFRPFREAGATALDNYGNLLGFGGPEKYAKSYANYTESPFVPDLIKKAREAVDSSRAAAGGLFSGGTAQEIGDRASNIYLGDYNNYLDRLFGVSQMGAGAAGQTANYGQQTANNVSNALGNIGQSRAQGAYNQGAILGNMFGQVAQGIGAGEQRGWFGPSSGEKTFLDDFYAWNAG